MRVRVDVDTARAEAKVFEVSRRLDRNEVLSAIGREVHDWITTNIRQRGQLAGGWPPLRPNTRIRHRSPLIRTGAMLRSFGFVVSGNRVTIGSPSRVARYMHFGTQPHRIDGNPILRFPTTQGIVHRRSVQHPGTPPRQLIPNRSTTRAIGVRILREQVHGGG